MKTRTMYLLVGTLLIAAGASFFLLSRDGAGRAGDAVQTHSVTMYKSPACACCEQWAAHARKSGMIVSAVARDDVRAVKEKLGVPTDLTSCHTAVVDGYVVEGHVPAASVSRMLADRPPIVGLAVAGMPAGSPGMESAGNQPFQVMAFDEYGRRYVYASY